MPRPAPSPPTRGTASTSTCSGWAPMVAWGPTSGTRPRVGTSRSPSPRPVTPHAARSRPSRGTPNTSTCSGWAPTAESARTSGTRQKVGTSRSQSLRRAMRRPVRSRVLAPPEQIDVFWVGPDGGVGTNFWNQAEGWHQPFPIAPPAHAAAGGIVAFSRRPGQIDVFWVGPDGGVGTNFWNQAEGWHQPFPIAPPGHAAPGAITAFSRHPEHIDVFWVGPDGGVGPTSGTRRRVGIRHSRSLRGAMRRPVRSPRTRGIRSTSTCSGSVPMVAWERISGTRPRVGTTLPHRPPGHAAPGAVTAHSRHPDHLDVFWVGPDGGVGTAFWTGV